MFRSASTSHAVGRAARLGAAFALLVVGVEIGGCASAGKDAQAAEERASADKFYEVAVGSFQNGMYSDAERNLDRALSIDEAHANALYLRGLISLVEGKDVCRGTIDGELDRIQIDALKGRVRVSGFSHDATFRRVSAASLPQPLRRSVGGWTRIARDAHPLVGAKLRGPAPWPGVSDRGVPAPVSGRRPRGVRHRRAAATPQRPRNLPLRPASESE